MTLPRVFLFGFSLVILIVTPLAAETPRRFMAFLARDAVLRESPETAVLAGPGVSFDVVVHDPADKDAARAAVVLAEYFQKIAGLSPVKDGARKIRLDTGEAALGRFPELKTADAHGFLISTREGDLHIASGTGIGALYGTWFFLQNYAGLRILMQGDLGEVFDKRERIDIPRELYVFNPGPDFQLRIHSGLQELDAAAWLQDRPDTQRYQYHHNLFEIFSPQKFGSTHPEFFPSVGGRRYIPGPGINSGWQPVLSSEESVQRAIAYADELFTGNPLMKTVSLTPNDGAGWAEEDLRAAEARGVPIRDIFYDFMNQVARGIRAKWPDKFVTALSYLEYQDPPSFPLEDNCMIFIWTKDGNVEPEFAKWRDKVKHFGNYQWIYGSAYPFPNHWPHTIQEFLHLLRGEGAVAFKSEFYDFHGHGCVRLWVLSNLLWNTDADVDALLRDYFEHAYGKAAAPAMGRYFAQWEQVYERRRRPGAFHLVDRKGAERKFETITDGDIAACQIALDEAKSQVTGEANRRRIDMVAAMFDRARHYREHVKQLQVLRAGIDAPGTVAEGIDRLRTAAAMLDAEQAVYQCNVKQIEPLATYCGVPLKGPHTEHLPWRTNYLAMDPRILLVTADSRWLVEDQRIARIARAVTGLQTPDQARSFWDKITAEHPILKPYAETERLALRGGTPLVNLAANGSFEQAAEPDSPAAIALLADMRAYKMNWMDADHCEVPYVAVSNWNALQKRCPETVKITRDTTEKREGAASLRVESSGQLGGILTHIELPDPRARYRLTFWHKAPRGGRISYGAMFYRIRPMPYFDHSQEAAKDWTKVEVEFPFNHDLAADERCALTLWLGIWTGTTETPVWFDDVRLERIGPP